MTRRPLTVALGAVSGLLWAGVARASGPETPVPQDPVGLLLAWHFDPAMLAGLGALALAYLVAVWRVDRAHPANPWQHHRTAAFLGAMGALLVAELSIVEILSDDLFTMHMVQHLLLVSVAAPLLAASGIGTLALRAASPTVRKRVLLPTLHSRIVSAVTFPIVGGIAFVVVLWVSHFSALYDLALVDDRVHGLQHVLYVSAAALFWWPLLSPDPLRWRLHPGAKLIALLFQMIPMSFLAVVILGADRPLYPAYVGRPEQFGIDVMTDQQMAGSLMWVTNDFAFLVPAAYCLWQLAKRDEQEARRADALRPLVPGGHRRDGP